MGEARSPPAGPALAAPGAEAATASHLPRERGAWIRGSLGAVLHAGVFSVLLVIPFMIAVIFQRNRHVVLAPGAELLKFLAFPKR